MLHSIPPMGGIPLSVRCGRPARPSAAQDTFQPRVIAANPDTRSRDAYRKALAMKREQLRTILAGLETQTEEIFQQEAEFVRCQLKNLIGGDNG